MGSKVLSQPAEQEAQREHACQQEDRGKEEPKESGQHRAHGNALDEVLLPSQATELVLVVLHLLPGAERRRVLL